MKKSNKILVFILVALLALSFCACKGKTKTNTVKSTDGIYKLEAPTSWDDVTGSGDLNDTAIMELSSDKAEKYMIMLSYSIDYFSTTKEFADYFMGTEIYSYYSVATAGSLKETAILNSVGYYADVTISYSGTNVPTRFYFMLGDDEYLLVMGWTGDKNSDSNIAEIHDMVTSLQFVK